MDIGEPIRKIIVVPEKEPIPQFEPSQEPEPERRETPQPQPEQVPA